MTQRVPASVMLSLAAHAAFLMLFLGFVKEGPKQAAQIIDGVDLLIAPAAPRPAPLAKPALSTMDFLKMALPAAPPRRAELAAVDVKLPESRRPLLADAPKLEESTRRLSPKLDALDLSRSRVSAAKLDAEPVSRRRAAETLAALPKLEEVGRRRVKNLPEALALEDRRREATAILGGALDAPRPTSRRQAAAAAAVLAEPEAPAPSAARKGLSVLPDQLVLRPRAEAAFAPKVESIAPAAPKLERRQAAAATEGGPKKGVEIEGPLKDRKVVSADIPKFPEWARTQGMMEAEVAIRFNVDAEGSVMPGMRVERTSGYGRLDRLCMDSLRNWTFVPAPGSGAQWGVITFRFILE
ncbi:MAG: TonB family protein [Elusimicrobiota bacterium]|nr:TonB family protein [Elusimicrobiota bacterium]